MATAKGAQSVSRQARSLAFGAAEFFASSDMDTARSRMKRRGHYFQGDTQRNRRMLLSLAHGHTKVPIPPPIPGQEGDSTRAARCKQRGFEPRRSSRARRSAERGQEHV